MNAAAALWARSMLRRNWRATIFLTLFAGIAAGAVMTAFEVARRTDSVIARRERYLEFPDVTVDVCSKDFKPETYAESCYRAADSADVRDRLLAIPGVHRVARGHYSFIGLRPPGSSEPLVSGANYVSQDVDGDVWATSRLHIVEGRTPRLDAPDEIVISESFAANLGARVGERYDMRAFTEEDFFANTSGGSPSEEATGTVQLVGIVRVDVSAEVGGGQGAGSAWTSWAWWAAHGQQAMDFGAVYVLWTDAGRSDQEALAARLVAAFPDRHLELGEGGTSQDHSASRAVSTQSLATFAAAIVALFAVLLFVGQTLVRQLLRDLADRSKLRALGIARWGIQLGALCRAAPIAAGAAGTAVLVAVLASPLGPVGVGRRAEIDLGVSIDGPVLALGALATAGFVLVIAAIVGFSADLRTSASAPRSWRPGPLPVSSSVSLAWWRSPDVKLSLRGAVAATGAGLAAVSASFVLLSSLDDLHGHPARTGLTYDYVSRIGVASEDNTIDGAVEKIRALGVVATASTINGVGRALPGGKDDEPLVALEPKIGDGVATVVLAGRAPQADDEIALGAVTMRRLGVAIGDAIDGVGASIGRDVGSMKVVGQIVVPPNDIGTVGLGRGGMVTTSTLDRLGAEAAVAIAISVDPSVPTEVAENSLSSVFGNALLESPASGDVANLDRIAVTPKLLSGLILALAGAALTHALLTVIRRRRRDIGTVQALGFTRSQVSATVAWQATAIALAAGVVGIVVGIIVGRWGWTLIERRLGIVSPSHVPTPLLAAAVLIAGAMIVANLVAVVPGWRAARVNVAEALRGD